MQVPRLLPLCPSPGLVRGASCHIWPRTALTLCQVIATVFKNLLQIYPVKLEFLNLPQVQLLNSSYRSLEKISTYLEITSPFKTTHTKATTTTKPAERRHRGSQANQKRHFKVLIEGPVSRNCPRTHTEEVMLRVTCGTQASFLMRIPHCINHHYTCKCPKTSRILLASLAIRKKTKVPSLPSSQLVLAVCSELLGLYKAVGTGHEGVLNLAEEWDQISRPDPPLYPC